MATDLLYLSFQTKLTGNDVNPIHIFNSGKFFKRIVVEIHSSEFLFDKRDIKCVFNFFYIRNANKYYKSF